MRISDITDRFIRQEKRSGAYMQSLHTDDGMMLRYTYNSQPIAEIYDYKDPQNYRLRLHPRQRAGKTEHNNRLNAVLVSVQKLASSDGSWANVRYSTHVRYSLKVYDQNLESEYTIKDYPMEFVLKDGRLTIDYVALEARVTVSDTSTEHYPKVVAGSSTSLQNVNSELNAILAGA